MEMARIANRMILVGALWLGAAGACSKSVCPNGMRLDTKRSKPGVNAYCEGVGQRVGQGVGQDIGDTRAAFIELHRGGGRRQICAYVGGRPAGVFQAFHPDGARWLEGQYDNGRKSGRWTQWAPDGHRVADGEYRNGVMIEGAPVGFPAVCEAVTW
jgi:hypothetical protein